MRDREVTTASKDAVHEHVQRSKDGDHEFVAGHWSIGVYGGILSGWPEQV
jgi:hypothetical protein